MSSIASVMGLVIRLLAQSDVPIVTCVAGSLFDHRLLSHLTKASPATKTLSFTRDKPGVGAGHRVGQLIISDVGTKHLDSARSNHFPLQHPRRIAQHPKGVW